MMWACKSSLAQNAPKRLHPDWSEVKEVFTGNTGPHHAVRLKTNGITLNLCASLIILLSSVNNGY